MTNGIAVSDELQKGITEACVEHGVDFLAVTRVNRDGRFDVTARRCTGDVVELRVDARTGDALAIIRGVW